jgi:hypothetical protein
MDRCTSLGLPTASLVDVASQAGIVDHLNRELRATTYGESRIVGRRGMK